MLHPTPEKFREELELLSQQLAGLSEEFRQHDLVSEPNKALMERMQRDKEHLASKLADVEGKRAK